MSQLYPFIFNMWIMGKDEAYVDKAFNKGYITLDEKNAIIATPQVIQ